MDLDFLRGLIEAIDDSGVDHIDITRGGTRIRISKTPEQVVATSVAAPVAAPVMMSAAPAAAEAAAAPAAAATPTAAEPAAGPASRAVEVKSPMVGTFYRSPSPDAPSYVEVGTHVARGQTLCILEAMKLMNELEAEVAGVVREVLVGNGEPVEYGQVLFRIEPDA